MTPLKYHIYIECPEKEKTGMRFNLTEEEVYRLIITPYMAGKPFMFCGRFVNPTKIQEVFIFSSQEDASKLVLPNREEVANHSDKKFVVEYIKRGKVKTVQACTEKFLPTKPPQA